ncbi:hypothetical protein B0H14DRAFT_2917196 [Mycena olivaceomarginata]|nr:hypothetical protein B0H14DRAFT_2917196 [Mycena olivaceomarginata]
MPSDSLVGVPPPSPEAPVARWGPPIDAVRGVRAVERARGSGGWGGVRSCWTARWCSIRQRDSRGMGAGRRRGYFAGGFGERHASGGYTAVETRQTGMRRVGSGTEEDEEVDLVSGGVAADPTPKDHVRGKTRRRESKREVVPESVCSPKMRKRWTADVPTPTYGPPRVGKDNDERLPSPPPRLFLAPPPPPPRFGSLLTPSPPQGVFACPSSSTSFALFSPMSPHPALAARVRLSFPLARVQMWR